ncbi:LacI family DNA-binding transcriptional regulator [Deinococcus petrolearius]|uniref:LacI family DNA-binding transcriptional regulator n=1 Tax=Deinococcus petrolearius TaxID=1751295 RepID=A0ABW1DHF3_9DEIO
MTRATLKDVAAHAGVSHQTVSNVLNGHPSIRPATRERVLSSISALDYHPNQAAKALREARVTTLCFASFGHDPDTLSDPYRNLIQAALTAEANAHGYSLATAFLDHGAASLEDLRQRYLQRVIGGAVIIGTQLRAAQWERITSWGLNVVLLDHLLPAPAHTVSADYRGGMAALVAHHVSRGRRDLALVLPTGDYGSTAMMRRDAFFEAAQACGVRARHVDGDWTYAAGERAVRELHAAGDLPDALLGGNDRMATGALSAAHRLGLSVPGDLAVSGFDDFDFVQYLHPTLTTVRVPHAEMAREAMRHLIALTGGEAPQAPAPYPVSLIVRDSA